MLSDNFASLTVMLNLYLCQQLEVHKSRVLKNGLNYLK